MVKTVWQPSTFLALNFALLLGFVASLYDSSFLVHQQHPKKPENRTEKRELPRKKKV